MDYSSEVRRRFAAPARAVEPDSAGGWGVAGAAEDRSLNIWVRFQVQAEGAVIRRVRFSAFGCPHTLAAADLIAESLEGRLLEALVQLDSAAVARTIGLPREKHGKLLRMEDALAEIHHRLVGKEGK